MSEAPSYPIATFVVDPETGKQLIVEHDDRYSELLRTFHAGHCQHPEKQAFRYKVSNGAVVVRECCIVCGQASGTALSQKDKTWVSSLPWLPEELALDYEGKREAEKRLLLVDLARQQLAERGERTQGYNEYMASPEWAAKRELVMKRCGRICEGCGVKAATEVHHHHYDHLYDEFLFELVGLCHGCHDRITTERKEWREAIANERLTRAGLRQANS